MGCCDGVQNQENAFKLTPGSDAVIPIRMQKKSCNGCISELPIPNFTSATLKIKNTDGSFNTLAGALVSADLGSLNFPIAGAAVALLESGLIDAELKVVQSVAPLNTVVELRGVLFVDKALS